MRSALMTGIVGAALAASLAGCATSPYTYNDRDEPIDRSAGGQYQYRGTVVRVDEPQQVVVLDNGQMYRVSNNQAILVNGQPVVLSRVQPGTPVTIVSGTPVVYQNGQYVAVPAGVATLPPTTTTVTAPPATTVMAPATTVVTAPTSNVVRMYGRVSDIDRSGNVKVRMADGNAFEFRAPAGTVLRKGDTVAIDMTFGAVVPSALPR
jgi:hypothetical protein